MTITRAHDVSALCLWHQDWTSSKIPCVLNSFFLVYFPRLNDISVLRSMPHLYIDLREIVISSLQIEAVSICRFWSPQFLLNQLISDVTLLELPMFMKTAFNKQPHSATSNERRSIRNPELSEWSLHFPETNKSSSLATFRMKLYTCR